MRIGVMQRTHYANGKWRFKRLRNARQHGRVANCKDKVTHENGRGWLAQDVLDILNVEYLIAYQWLIALSCDAQALRSENRIHTISQNQKIADDVT